MPADLRRSLSRAPLEIWRSAPNSLPDALEAPPALRSTLNGGFAMYRSLFPPEIFAEMDRLQREMQQAFDLSPSIRGFGRGGFPALNIGTTPEAIHIYAFAPGIDASKLEVHL